MTNLLHVEPRSRTILRHTRQAIAARRLRVLPFSEAVADRYLAMTSPENRAVPLREQGDTMRSALAAKDHNGQVIDRLVKGKVKTFPADLEDTWVQELPQPYRQRCEIELAARRGHAIVRDPRADDPPAEQGGELSDLLREVGHSVEALAPIFANGTVDAEDRPHAAKALQELGDLLTATLQLHHRLTSVVIKAPLADCVPPVRGRA